MLAVPAGRTPFDERGDRLVIVRLGRHLLETGLGVAPSGQGRCGGVDRYLALCGPEAVGADVGDERAGEVEGGVMAMVVDQSGDQAHAFGFVAGEAATRQEQVAGAAVTDEAGEKPGQAVLGWEVELAVGRGPGGAADRNPEIAPAGKGETDPSSGAVDGSDGDDVEPEKGSEVGVEGRIDAMAGGGDVVGSAGVVAARSTWLSSALLSAPGRRSGLRDRR